MSVCDSLCASCTEFYKFLFPTSEQQDVQILSEGVSINVIHQTTGTHINTVSDQQAL
jgi:hypothetical protein